MMSNETISESEMIECQFHNNCGGWCETRRELEHNLCEHYLEAHDEEMTVPACGTISVPREDLEDLCEKIDSGANSRMISLGVHKLRALLAQPALAVKQYGQDSVTGHSDVEVTISRVTHYDHGPNVAEALARLACRVARFYKLEAPTLANPAEQHQGEPVAQVEVLDSGGQLWIALNAQWLPVGVHSLYTRPGALPDTGTSSDKYKAELYDEVWQKAKDMGFGNVTDALMQLEKQLQGNKSR